MYGIVDKVALAMQKTLSETEPITGMHSKCEQGVRGYHAGLPAGKDYMRAVSKVRMSSPAWWIFIHT